MYTEELFWFIISKFFTCKPVYIPTYMSFGKISQAKGALWVEKVSKSLA